MLKTMVKQLVLSVTAVLVLGIVAVHAREVAIPARVITHTGINGQIQSAVVLKSGELEQSIIARDHLILLDTSASQVGEHRLQSLAVLKSLLQSLPAGDRVRLFAVDLQADPMGDDFSEAHSQETADRLEQLQDRVPLGATNLERALRTAMNSAADRRTDITYIGDGMSTADLIEIPEMQALVSDLRARQMPVHSFCVGAQRNLQVLGILAHQTGGFISFDSQISTNDRIEANKTKSSRLVREIARVNRGALERATDQGNAMAAALSLPVYFPASMHVVPQTEPLLPSNGLPIRSDRETIYLIDGVLPANARITMTCADGEAYEWKLAAPIDQPGATFLPDMVRRTATTNGWANPLAGMTLFQLAQVEFTDSVTALAQRGVIALQQGDAGTALKIADIVEKADPGHPAVKILRSSSGQLSVTPSSQTGDPIAASTDDFHVAPNPGASLLEDQRQMILLQTQKLRNEVSSAIEQSSHATDPAVSLGHLKQLLGALKSAINIAPEERQRLQKQLQSAIATQENRQEIQQQQLTRALESRAQQEALGRLVEQAMLDEERLDNLIDRVRTLMLEGAHGRDSAYAEAQEVADVAINLRPGEGSSAAARFDAESAQQLNRAYRLRARRADQVLETLHQVELSHIPFPDEPPIRFPPAEVWKALSERRRATATVDLKKSTPNEKRIQKALSETTEVSFTDNPLEEALNYLEDLHHIEIWLDKAALSDEGVNSDQQINLVMSGISLRSALRLMLEPLGLTYLIEDEVMKITTQAKADEKMSTRVYPVADLVIPIQPPMGLGGGLGGGGGFGGSDQGGGLGGGLGGGGGFGGGGGGFGGGGFGGGGGGFFSIPPERVRPGTADGVESTGHRSRWPK